MEKIIFIINRCWLFFCALLIIAYFKLANRLKVYGLKSIPFEGGVLIASNHVSMFETIIIPSSIILNMPGQKVFAPVKAELLDIPVLNKVLSSWGSFPVKRGSSHISAMKKITKLLETEKVMVFPEGTRSKTGKIGQGNRMLGRIILEAKPIVIPARVFGAENLLGTSQKGPRPFRKIQVKFGNPVNLESLYTSDSDTKELSQKIINTIMGAISRINI